MPLSTDGFSTKEVKKPSVLNSIHRALARQLHTSTCHRIPDSGTKKYTRLTRLTFVESGAETSPMHVKSAVCMYVCMHACMYVCMYVMCHCIDACSLYLCH